MGHPELVEGRAQWPTSQCFDKLSMTPANVIPLQNFAKFYNSVIVIKLIENFS
jgi:hypothetical protein